MPRLEGHVALITGGGGEIGTAIDIASPASCEATLNATIKALGKLTTLVNVAATSNYDRSWRAAYRRNSW